MDNINCTLSLSILSGKGGVGKTNLALNLGYALFQAGHPLMLMDCDLGLANLDVLLGLSPERNLQDLLLPGVEVQDVVVGIEEGGFDFLPATSGVPELVELDEDIQELLFEKLKQLACEYEYLLLDLGAGISKTVLSFAAVSHLKLVVVTPEPTSLTDSYALMKVLQNRHGLQNFHILVNQVSGPDEAKLTYERLKAACKKFLGLEIRFLGGIRHDPALAEAVRRQVPLLKHSPQSPAAQDILTLAKRIQGLRNENLIMLSETMALKNLPRAE
jgi:flagellar biosynthesis protein FlhG